MSSSYVNINNMVRKDITQKIQKEKAILDHIWQWKETPENSGKPLTVKNYDDCMLASARLVRLLSFAWQVPKARPMPLQLASAKPWKVEEAPERQ